MCSQRATCKGGKEDEQGRMNDTIVSDLNKSCVGAEVRLICVEVLSVK